MVQLLIDERGNVVSALILSGDPLLHASTVYAAHRWKFRPAKVNKHRARVTGTITYAFPAPKSSPG